MFTLIIGGSASGKSSYAEQLAVSLPGTGPRIYLATMEAFGAEAQARIARHRQMRRGRGFETLECTRDLSSAPVPAGSSILLEDMGNLAANELFGDPGPGKKQKEARSPEAAVSKILAGVEHLYSGSAHLTIVTNDVFSAGNEYAGDTARYLRVLADVNRVLAARADQVVEVVCGQPAVLRRRGEDAVEEVLGGGRIISGKEDGMIFVTGPLYAGKQDYIMHVLGWDQADFAADGVRDVQDLAAEAVRGTAASEEDILRGRLLELADRLAQKKVVIATEIGGGVVPVDPLQRREREAAGRLSCLLAERAEKVVRVCCGLPRILKQGEKVQ